MATAKVKVAKVDPVLTNLGINVRNLDKMIVKIGTAVGKLKGAIHEAAMQVMHVSHYHSGGQLDRLLRLYDAIGTSGNKEQFRRWVCTFFPVSFRPAEKGANPVFKLNKAALDAATKAKIDTDTLWRFDEAREAPWYDFKTDAEAKAEEFTLDKLIASIEHLTKRVDKMEKEGHVNDPRVKEAVAMLGASKDSIVELKRKQA